jgi:hypothetical protein
MVSQQIIKWARKLKIHRDNKAYYEEVERTNVWQRAIRDKKLDLFGLVKDLNPQGLSNEEI